MQSVRLLHKLVDLLLSVDDVAGLDACSGVLSRMLRKVCVGPRLEEAGDGTACQLVERLDLELLAEDEQFLQTIDVLIKIVGCKGLQLEESHVLL